jgi:hypothetical protein
MAALQRTRRRDLTTRSNTTLQRMSRQNRTQQSVAAKDKIPHDLGGRKGKARQGRRGVINSLSTVTIAAADL